MMTSPNMKKIKPRKLSPCGENIKPRPEKLVISPAKKEITTPTQNRILIMVGVIIIIKVDIFLHVLFTSFIPLI